MIDKKKKERRKEVVGLLLMTSALLVGAAMLSYDMSEEPGNVTQLRTNNYLGIGGVYLSHYLIKMFLGIGSAVIPVLLFIWGFWMFTNRRIKALLRFTLLLLVLALLFSTGMALLLGKPWALPGVLGGLFAGFLQTFLGTLGAWVFVSLTMLLVITGY
ncbi:MAG: DNA translocase FtsK 4TM domain-containing protein, partial [Candidatus Marinimicrobia bacterium]|nr:DNA translocase FtsK 4TM domain-containing protein [Candidatus Neomarinimicrobiota bacterium]